MLGKYLGLEAAEHKVTFCFYAEMDEQGQYPSALFEAEVAHSLNIADRLVRAATMCGHKAPLIVFHYFLVPSQAQLVAEVEAKGLPSGAAAAAPDESPAPVSEAVIQGRRIFEAIFNAILEAKYPAGDAPMQLQPFRLSEHEASYLSRVRCVGSDLIDFMKISAMISNRQYHHLQLDTNTVIHDYDAFYKLTFNAQQPYPQFILNVYSKRLPYFSVNCKVVYFPAGIQFTEDLSTFFNAHLVQHLEQREMSLYDHVFNSALEREGILNAMHFIRFSEETMRHFAISKAVFIRVLKSWKKQPGSTVPQHDLPVLKQYEFDFLAFKNLLFKHTTPLVPDIASHARYFRHISMEADQQKMKEYIDLLAAHGLSDSPVVQQLYDDVFKNKSSVALALIKQLKSDLGLLEPPPTRGRAASSPEPYTPTQLTSDNPTGTGLVGQAHRMFSSAPVAVPSPRGACDHAAGAGVAKSL